MAENKAYTYKALAERWACSVDLIYKMVRRGEIKTFRIGRATRISASEVERIEGGNQTV
jgi:excisionase family DNA binding protein|nr:MAG TPA: helix-turn-helix domain protein [Caudoviricetes sp.]